MNLSLRMNNWKRNIKTKIWLLFFSARMKVLKIKSPALGANRTLIKKIQKGISNQVKENDWYTSYSQDFSVYDKVYDWSYIVAGIVDKITLGINSGRDIEDWFLKEAVKMVRIGFIAKSLAKYGNAFLEISRNKKWEIQAIYPVAAKSIKQIKGRDSRWGHSPACCVHGRLPRRGVHAC